MTRPLTCRAAEAEIQKSLDGLLTAAGRARLDSHLASCASCRREWGAQGRLARAARRWATPADDPGEEFTARVLARIAARPAPAAPPRLWLPLAATLLLLGLPALLLGPIPLPGPVSPHLGAVGASARLLPGWLLANLRAVPGDAAGSWGALTAGGPAPPWLWPALLGAAAANGVFCARAGLLQARRSPP